MLPLNRPPARAKVTFRSLALAALSLTAILVTLSPAQADAPGAGTEVSLEWDPSESPDVVNYRLYLGTAPGSYSLSWDVGVATMTKLVGLPIGGTYFFAVTAIDSEGSESDYSNEVFFRGGPATVSVGLEDGMIAIRGLGLPGSTYGILRIEPGAPARQIAIVLANEAGVFLAYDDPVHAFGFYLAELLAE